MWIELFDATENDVDSYCKILVFIENFLDFVMRRMIR